MRNLSKYVLGITLLVPLALSDGPDYRTTAPYKSMNPPEYANGNEIAPPPIQTLPPMPSKK